MNSSKGLDTKWDDSALRNTIAGDIIVETSLHGSLKYNPIIWFGQVKPQGTQNGAHIVAQKPV